MLSADQVTALMPYLPTVIHFARSRDPAAGKFLLDDGGSHHNALLAGLNELYSVIHQYRSPSTQQLKSVLSGHPGDFWVKCVLHLISMPVFRMIPGAVAIEMLRGFQRLKRNSQMRSRDIAIQLSPSLDRVPWLSFTVLGELCSMCDAACKFDKNPRETRLKIGHKLGPLLFLTASERSKNKQNSLASAVMRTCIKECSFLFGVAAGKPKPYSMGVRLPGDMKNNSVTTFAPNSPFSPRPPPRTPARNNSKQTFNSKETAVSKMSLAPPKPLPRGFTEEEFEGIKDELRQFYSWRDKPYMRIVDDLFDAHEFLSIAEGILHKYQLLPRGWLVALQGFQDRGVRLPWFDHRTITYVDRPLFEYPPTDYSPIKSIEESKVNTIVDEIIDNERNFHRTMTALMEKYVFNAQQYVLGNSGTTSKNSKELMKKFGLTIQELDEIFGGRLHAIIDLSNEMLVAMEPISLVRKNTLYKSRENRIAEVFVQYAAKLRCFAPYMSAHPSCARILKKGADKVNKLKNLEIMADWSGDLPPPAMNFMRLWNEVSDADPLLANLSIEGVLIKPVQQVPRYKIFLERLIKETPNNHLVKKVLEEALDVVTAAAKEINKAVRQHLKVEAVMGQDIVSPKMARVKAKDGKDGFFSVLNMYPN